MTLPAVRLGSGISDRLLRYRAACARRRHRQHQRIMEPRLIELLGQQSVVETAGGRRADPAPSTWQSGADGYTVLNVESLFARIRVFQEVFRYDILKILCAVLSADSGLV